MFRLIGGLTSCLVLAIAACAAPVYPATAVLAGKGGHATIDCTITQFGVAKDCVVVATSEPALSDSALDYITHARFRPAMRDGVAVPQFHHIWSITFKVPG